MAIGNDRACGSDFARPVEPSDELSAHTVREGKGTRRREGFQCSVIMLVSHHLYGTPIVV